MSKYKFSLNPRVKGIIEWQLEHYKEDKRQLDEMKNDMIPSGTAGYSLTAGVSGGDTHRCTEDVALRIATNPYIAQLERSTAAIDKVLLRCKDEDLRLIDLIYWKRSYTVEGAGMEMHMARRTAYRHINDILTEIALEIGYVTV